MLGSFLQGAPLWVWPLLVLLIFIGIKATRDRSAPVWMVYFLPLLGILSLRSVNALPASGPIWGVFLAAYIIGVALGFRYQKTVILGRDGGRVQLAGEWLTFGLLMVVFWMNFVGGVMKSVAPLIYSGPVFPIIFAVFAGMASGIFLGRAARVFKASS